MVPIIALFRKLQKILKYTNYAVVYSGIFRHTELSDKQFKPSETPQSRYEGQLIYHRIIAAPLLYAVHTVSFILPQSLTFFFGQGRVKYQVGYTGTMPCVKVRMTV